MNELDDFLCEQQSDEFEYEEEYCLPSAAKRRKNDWRHAKHGYNLLKDKWGSHFLKYFKPLHYYSKTKPEVYYQRANKTNNKGRHRTAYGNYNPAKNWSIADKRKIQNGENQIKELFDTE